MALIRDVRTVIDIPHEAGQTVTIRRLTWRQLAQARRGREQEQREGLKQLGAEFLKAIREQPADAAQPVGGKSDDSDQYKVGQYSLADLLLLGVVAWSYPEPVNAEALDLLDEQTAQWLGQAILDYTRPANEGERKNG